VKVVLCVAPGEMRIEERPDPSRAENEVLVRIRRIGICGTDLHIFRGRQPFASYPRVLGHELAAEVIEAPHGSGLSAGARVCIMPYLSCGECIACRKGRTNCCVNIAVLGVHRDGGMAERMSVPEAFVLPAGDLDWDTIAMVEFLAIGLHAVRRADPQPGSRALVVGAGPIGLAVATFARLAGCSVSVMDLRADRLDFARQVVGVDHAIPAGEATVSLPALTQGEFFDVVFDATGNPDAMQAGFHYVSHGGTYVLVSIVPEEISFSDPEFHKRETTLLASRNATRDDFLEVMHALRTGRVRAEPFRSHRALLSDLPQALPAWAGSETQLIKAIVEV
jgi:2-desacetyl-2-hydroxyethyl bacteriochlorophyllide A dehydrogenase